MGVVTTAMCGEPRDGDEPIDLDGMIAFARLQRVGLAHHAAGKYSAAIAIAATE